MKKIIIFLISLSLLIPFNIKAKEEKVLTIDMSKYTSIDEMKLIEADHYHHLKEQNIIRTTVENNKVYFTNSSGKKLMENTNSSLPDEYSTYRILDGIGENDTIEYTITNDDKELFLDRGVPKKYIYDKVILKFGPQDFSKEDYIIEIKAGYNVINNYSNLGNISMNGLFNNIIKIKEVTELRSLSGKILLNAETTIGDNSDSQKITIPSDVTKEDDIIYNLTEEEKTEFENEYDKVILNFSGHNYGTEARTIVLNMKEEDPAVTFNHLYENSYGFRNKLKLRVTNYINSLEGKKLAYITAELGAEEPDAFLSDFYEAPIIICDGVGEADTIYYNIPEQSELRKKLSSNYKRIIIKFIPEEKTTPNKPIVNPKTLYNILIILGILLITSISTIIMKKQNY